MRLGKTPTRQIRPISCHHANRLIRGTACQTKGSHLGHHSNWAKPTHTDRADQSELAGLLNDPPIAARARFSASELKTTGTARPPWRMSQGRTVFTSKPVQQSAEFPLISPYPCSKAPIKAGKSISMSWIASASSSSSLFVEIATWCSSSLWPASIDRNGGNVRSAKDRPSTATWAS